MRVRFFLLLLAGLFLLSMPGTPTTVHAEGGCRINVDTILATRGDNTIDPTLEKHINDLQAMFSYTSYRSLGSQTLDLQVGQSGTVALPGNHRLKITPQKIRGKRADIALQMMKKDRTVFHSQIEILNRGSLFVGGPTYLNGNLIFRISSSY